MAQSADEQAATELLMWLADGEKGARITPGVALELARHLAHIAGGDGRGVYAIVHDPKGDRRWPSAS